MKKTLATMVAMTLAMGVATNALAKTEKKNPPRNSRAVEEALKEVDGEHYPERMKVSGSKMPIKAGDTYYHCFSGTLKEGGYHVIIFDNTPKYLGFYKTKFEPYDYEEGALMLNSGECDEDGNDIPFLLPITAKGPADKVNINGVVTPFVKNPNLEAKKEPGGVPAGPAKVATKEGKALVPEYREWTINMRGKQMKFTAIYVQKSGTKVTLKEQKRGLSNDFPIAALSKEDQAYLKQFK